MDHLLGPHRCLLPHCRPDTRDEGGAAEDKIQKKRLKVVVAAWGTEFIKFLAALAILL